MGSSRLNIERACFEAGAGVTLGQSLSVALMGLEGQIVTVEVDIADGLPAYVLLGLPDAALTESRDRVRSAMVNCMEAWPNRKVTVSLSPAWLPKSGSSFDLPIAIALLSAQKAIPTEESGDIVYLGELALDGHIRGVRGVLPSLIAAHKSGVRTAVVPWANRVEAQLMHEMTIVPMEHLNALLRWLRTGERAQSSEIDVNSSLGESEVDFSDVAGQEQGRYAAEVAAVGAHHLLLMGPPGAGKTMIAQRLPGILPVLTREESLEVTAIHSIAGGLSARSPLASDAPFVAPHHSATRVAMVGGGSHTLKPGACSLAHRGVLFVDEAPECDSGVLDSLRQPLESGSITIARAIGTVSYPARFLLVLAANPCPCGKFSGRGRNCTCTSQQVRRYLSKLSGPLMDRIDLRVQVDSLSRVELSRPEMGESSSAIRNRVVEARGAAADRFRGEPWSLNSEIPTRALRTSYGPDRAALNFLHGELDRELLTARGLHKVMRIAWSIADLSGHARPTVDDTELAYSLRGGAR
ncbi:MAG TPA: YifB family Mg chelatase-like AAA ATPase [Candidatus Nanopelagicaceae bacterium]